MTASPQLYQPSPIKRSDGRAASFSELSVELDAIEPNLLRTIVRNAIECHIPRHQLDVLLAAEESEREALFNIVDMAQAEGIVQ